MDAAQLKIARAQLQVMHIHLMAAIEAYDTVFKTVSDLEDELM